MAAQEIPPVGDFYYRQNADGSLDSICLHCFLTIATAKSQQEMTGPEFVHTLHCCNRKPAASARAATN
jgi:hypothetical protein